MTAEQTSKIVAQIALCYEPTVVLHMSKALMRCDITETPEQFDQLFEMGRALGKMMEKEREDNDAWFGSPEHGRPDSVKHPIRYLVDGMMAGRVTIIASQSGLVSSD